MMIAAGRELRDRYKNGRKRKSWEWKKLAWACFAVRQLQLEKSRALVLSVLEVFKGVDLPVHRLCPSDFYRGAGVRVRNNRR